MQKIKFYSIDDMATGENLIRIKEIIDGFDENKKDYTINDIIEMYNITKYIDKECYKNYILNWTEEEISKIIITTKKYKMIVGRYINNISNKDLVAQYLAIEDDYYEYRDDFFELLEKYNKYENISENTFSNLLNNHKVHLEYVLKNKNLTNYYGDIIRKKFYENKESAEIILDYYETKHIGSIKNLYFPRKLTAGDKEKIIIKYINSQEPNINYLRLINNIKNREELSITDKTRLASIRRTRIENDKLFSDNSGFEYGAEVGFSNNQQNVVTFKKEKNIFKYSYDIRWIYENTDFSTLLNNFIYLFEYVDKQMRITLISKEEELGVTEKFLGIKSKNEYETGVIFNIKNMLSTLQMMSYYNELAKINIRLENVIEWFFGKYLFEEFGIENYIVKMPSKDSTYYEKCKSILPEIDYILKQFDLLVEDGKIDQELLEVSSKSVLFENVKSFIKDKYIYGNYKSSEFNNLCYYFFSDQCVLHYIEKYKNYNSFYKLLTNENVKVSDYSGYSKRLLNNAIEQEYVFVDLEGYIRIKDKIIIEILYDLYNNEFICYWKYLLKYREKIDKLTECNILLKGGSLFSKQEQDYFNFYLNQRSFNNTLDLRNKYLHGNKMKDDNETTHYNNYMLFLKFIILIIIKINDELCIKAKIEKNREKE